MNDGVHTPHNLDRDPPQTYADVVRGHNSNIMNNDKIANEKVKFATNILAH